MGLLDDAIREHLELKRRRGADPGEVAREQREVLDTPYQPDGGGQASGELAAASAAEADIPAESVGQPSDALESALAAEPGAGGASAIADDEFIAGETAELDMSTVLANDGEGGSAVVEEDSLEWETPQRERVSPEIDPSPHPRVE